MKLSKENLKEIFDGARKSSSPYVFVGIEAEGVKEVITIPATSFNAKEEFYNNAYSEDLIHVMNSNVKITGLAYGNTETLKDLI